MASINSNQNILEFYQDIVRQYQNEYGVRTICFCQVGSFYELYDDGSNLVPIKEIGDLLQIQVTRRNKSILEVSKTNHLMCGFPDYTLNKFLNMMVDHNYTVVVVSQVTSPPKPKRAITQIVSPGTKIENLDNFETSNMMSIYLEEHIDIYTNKNSKQKDLYVGVSIIDISTGISQCAEFSSKKRDHLYPLDEVYRLILVNNPKEIIIGGECSLSFEEICNHLDINNRYVHNKLGLIPTDLKNLAYQNQFLMKVFPNHGLISPIEYINLERFNISLVSYIMLLQFAFKHSELIVQRIRTPVLVENNSLLNISYNAFNQLQMKQVANVLNNCSTSVGKRYFCEKLYNPIKSVSILEQYYKATEELIRDDLYIKISKYLEDVYDIERLFRRIFMETLNPCEWCNIITSCDALIKTMITLKTNKYFEDNSLFSCNLENDLTKFIDSIREKLNMDKVYKYNMDNVDESFFNCGIYKDVDKLQNDYNDAISFFDVLVFNLNKLIGDSSNSFFKLEHNDKDGHYLLITAKRFKEFEAREKDKGNFIDVGSYKVNIKELVSKPVSSTSTIVKVSHPFFSKISNHVNILMTQLKDAVLKAYNSFLKESYKDHNNIMVKIIDYLKEVDYITTNAKNASNFKYSKPIIMESNKSSMKATALRHPLVERLQQHIKYIANDIELGIDNKDGILLFGINSAGKSTLMKSCGIAIVMAQAGMYVPCDTLEYSPYNNIFTRIPSGDDIMKGQSTFTVEILELRNILKRADDKSLVIGDELCSGTESISALSIVSAGIMELCKRKTSFIFASHLHDLVNIPQIKCLSNLEILHLDVRYDEQQKKLIYDRILKKGVGNTLYGLEVCRALDLEPEFLIIANDIRHQVLGTDSNIIGYNKTKYNAQKFIDANCALCGKKSSDVHHIDEQYKSDNKGFIDYFHKNSLFNLVCICEQCHQAVHSNHITIEGYKQTSQGVELLYKNNDFHKENINNQIDSYDKDLVSFLQTLRQQGLSINKIISTVKNEKNIDISVYRVNKMLKSFS